MMAVLLLLLLLPACKSPLEIDTPRRTRHVSPSEINNPAFNNDPGDSVFARVDGELRAFNTQILRKTWANRFVDDGYYLMFESARYSDNGTGFESISIRIDNIRDTGTFSITREFSGSKQIDPGAPPQVGATYERRVEFGFNTNYHCDSLYRGEVRITRFDVANNVLIGAFWFTAYNHEHRSTVDIDKGAFRCELIK